MKNLIVSWKELAKPKYGSIAEGVRHLNIACCAKITPSCINSMADGKKNIPNCINRFMIFEIAPSEYNKVESGEIDIGEFMERITIPARIK